jgi:hypothetical protein
MRWRDYWYKNCYKMISAIVILIIISACGDYAANRIIGKWEMQMSEKILLNGKVKKEKFPPGRIMEFYSDNTVKTPFTGTANWTILSDGRVKMDFGGIHTVIGIIKGSSLVLTVENEDNTRSIIYLKKM